MKTVKIILDFLTTIAHLFFRSRHKSKPCKRLVDGTGSPVRLPEEHRSGTGSCGGDTLTLQTDPPSTANLLGWALILAAAGTQVLKHWG